MHSIKCEKNFDLKNFNTYRISSIAPIAYFPQNVQEFIFLLKELETPFVLGGGSNILFSSGGIEQPVILTNKIDGILLQNGTITAEAGVKAPVASHFALENSLSGFEFLNVIPASVGGTVFMNASAHGQAISDVFINAKLFDMQTKKIVEFTKEQMEFEYRKSVLKAGRYIFLEGNFQLKQVSSIEIEKKMNENIEHRKCQPNLKTPNAGSVFKNPPNNSAGKIIEECNLKGEKIDDAEISKIHGNFIINNGFATSVNIVQLMFLAYNKVKSKFNIELEPENIFVGKKSELEEKIWKEMSKKPSE